MGLINFSRVSAGLKNVTGKLKSTKSTVKTGSPLKEGLAHLSAESCSPLKNGLIQQGVLKADTVQIAKKASVSQAQPTQGSQVTHSGDTVQLRKKETASISHQAKPKFFVGQDSQQNAQQIKAALQAKNPRAWELFEQHCNASGDHPQSMLEKLAEEFEDKRAVMAPPGRYTHERFVNAKLAELDAHVPTKAKSVANAQSRSQPGTPPIQDRAAQAAVKPASNPAESVNSSKSLASYKSAKSELETGTKSTLTEANVGTISSQPFSLEEKMNQFLPDAAASTTASSEKATVDKQTADKTVDKPSKSFFGRLFGKKQNHEVLNAGQSVKDAIRFEKGGYVSRNYRDGLYKDVTTLSYYDPNYKTAAFKPKGEKFEKPQAGFSYELSSDGTRLSKRARQHNEKLAKSIQRDRDRAAMAEAEQQDLQRRAEQGELIHGYNAYSL